MTEENKAQEGNVEDKRLQYILDEMGYDKESDLSQSDYERVEDNFIQGANDLVAMGEDQIDALVKAGFTDLAEQIKSLSLLSGAYDWARENL